MTGDERAQLEHRAAVRAALSTEAAEVARSAAWLAHQASYAKLPAPNVRRLAQAAELLGAAAEAIAGRVAAERGERTRLGLDPADYQQRIEEGRR